MNRLIVPFLLFPLLIFAQRERTFSLDLSDEPIELAGLSFNVDEVLEETGIEDGVYGKVYVGMMNKERPLVFENGLSLNLLTCLMRNIADPSLPPATLAVSYLRIDEEITFSSERRKLQIQASLLIENAEGQTLRYGPLQVADTKGGLDITSGHASAVAEAMSELLQELDELVSSGTVSKEDTSENPLAVELPDGAYYSVVDFRTGRVDTSLRLRLTEVRSIGDLDGVAYHEAYFERPEDIDRKDLREIWGYHHDGHSYRYVEKRFRQIQADENGEMMVVIPGGLTDTEAVTKQAMAGALFGALGALATSGSGLRDQTDIYQLDLVSGELLPIYENAETVAATPMIILHHVSDVADYTVSIRAGNATYTVPANTYVMLEGAAKVTITSGHGKQKPWYRDVAPRHLGQPTLYEIRLDERGKIDFDRMDDGAALVTAGAIGKGELTAATLE